MYYTYTLYQNVLQILSQNVLYVHTLSKHLLHINTVQKCVTNTYCPKIYYTYILSQNLLHKHTVPKIFVHTHCPKNVLHIHSLTKFILNFGIKVEPVTAAGADATVNDWLLFTYSINGHKPDIHISFNLLQLCHAWFLGVQIQIMKLALGQCTCSSAML